MGVPPFLHRPPPLSARTHPRCGTVLMEAVLCLPLLLFLVTGIVQFARIWEARLFVRYAAWNAARATLVRNEGEYSERNGATGGRRFFADRGPAWLAAVETLAWKSGTADSERGGDADFLFPGFSGYPLFSAPSSAFIREQVRIDPERSWESNGLVRVSVKFKFPLLFSVFALGVSGGEDGYDPVPLVHDGGADAVARTGWSDDIPHVLLRESCVLPKPWSTAGYPRVSEAEAAYLEMVPP